MKVVVVRSVGRKNLDVNDSQDCLSDPFGSPQLLVYLASRMTVGDAGPCTHRREVVVDTGVLQHLLNGSPCNEDLWNHEGHVGLLDHVDLEGPHLLDQMDRQLEGREGRSLEGHVGLDFLGHVGPLLLDLWDRLLLDREDLHSLDHVGLHFLDREDQWPWDREGLHLLGHEGRELSILDTLDQVICLNGASQDAFHLMKDGRMDVPLVGNVKDQIDSTWVRVVCIVDSHNQETSAFLELDR